MMTELRDDQVHNEDCLQNYSIIWLDEYDMTTGIQLKSNNTNVCDMIGDVHFFNDADRCIDFLTDIDEQFVFLVVSIRFGEQIIPYIYQVSHLHKIYIISKESSPSKLSIESCPKVVKIYVDLSTLCDDLVRAIRRIQHNVIPISFLFPMDDNSNINQNRLEPSFTYTKLFKEILMKMDYDKQARFELMAYCREHLPPCSTLGNILNEFERTYQPERAIWWYTRECFTYQILNRALRLLDVEPILLMGFFIVDLHRQIEQLYTEQLTKYFKEPFNVYRGQSLSASDMNKLMKIQDGLISFNSFLSTSVSETIPFILAESASQTNDTYGILFIITVDPNENHAKFANIHDQSYFGETENEILFTMNTVFKISAIIPYGSNTRLFKVLLTQTEDSDQRVPYLFESIQDDIIKTTPTDSLARLLDLIHKPDEIDKLCNLLMKRSTDPLLIDQYYLYHGIAEYLKGNHDSALESFESILSTTSHLYPPYSTKLMTKYSMIGLVHIQKGDYRKALDSHMQALEIRKRKLPLIDRFLLILYNNIASTYFYMRSYMNAIAFYKQLLDLAPQVLPVNHPSLGIVYTNVASIFNEVGKYSEAFELCQKALKIMKDSLPNDHPHVAVLYNVIGCVYHSMGSYADAVRFFDKALQMMMKSLPDQHSYLMNVYNNIGSDYNSMKDPWKALSFHEKALEIGHRNLPANHSSLVITYNHLAATYRAIGDHAKALEFCLEALKITRENPSNNYNPLLVEQCSDASLIFYELGKFEDALQLSMDGLEIMMRGPCGDDHASSVKLYNNIGAIYYRMKDYNAALNFHKKGFEKVVQILDDDHPTLAPVYMNIASDYEGMKAYSEALDFYERASKIIKKILPTDYELLASLYNNVGCLKFHMNRFEEAKIMFEEGLAMCGDKLPNNHELIITLTRAQKKVMEKLAEP